MAMAEPAVLDDELARLLGVRSSKASYYQEYRRGAESLDRTIRALEVVSRALTRLDAGPRALVEEALAAVVNLLSAEVAVIWPRHPAFPPPEDAAHASPSRRVTWCSHAAPAVASLLQRRRSRRRLDRAGQVGPAPAPDGLAVTTDEGTALAVPLRWSGRPGGRLVARWSHSHQVDGTDLAILASVANQLAAAVQASWLLAESRRLRDKTAAAYRELSDRAEELSRTNRQLTVARSALLAARTSQMVAEDRQRIARELHDTVAQQVLTLGMQVEWARGEVTDPAVAEQLAETKQLARGTVQDIRQAIFKLSSVGRGTPVGLPTLLRQVLDEHRTDRLHISLRIVGEPFPVPAAAEREIAMIAVVRLTFGTNLIRLSVADDGVGDPAVLRRHLESCRRASRDGYHRGLAFLDDRVRSMAGRLTITPSRIGGVRISVVITKEGWS